MFMKGHTVAQLDGQKSDRVSNSVPRQTVDGEMSEEKCVQLAHVKVRMSDRFCTVGTSDCDWGVAETSDEVCKDVDGKKSGGGHSDEGVDAQESDGVDDCVQVYGETSGRVCTVHYRLMWRQVEEFKMMWERQETHLVMDRQTEGHL